MWNLVSIHLETVLVSVQDKCTVYAKRNLGSEILLDTSNGTSYRLEIVQILKQDRCTVCAARTTGSKIILDADDGTPR
jgi:hypothetical protein